MTTELVEVANGVLEFHRDGRKLIKVSLTRRIIVPVALDYDCVHCGLMLEKDDHGVWRDLRDRFLCKSSPSSMHCP